MSDFTPFTVNHPGYQVVRLTNQDSDRLQALYVACTDFFLLTEGTAPSPTAAQDEFTDVPEGKTPDDLHLFGLCDFQERLVGVITALQHYPDDETWWIGLMLLAPDQRGQGLGAAFYRAFEQWLSNQGANYVALSAIADNAQGRAFWQRLGFKEMRRTTPRSYGQKIHEVYVYHRQISAAPAPSEQEDCMFPAFSLPPVWLAEAADMPQLAQLYYETVVHNAPRYYTEAQTQAWASFALDQTAFAQFLEGVTTFVMAADADLLGFAGVAADGHVTAVYVRGDRLGQGIGSQLLQTLLEYADSQGMQRLYAEASEFSLGLFLKFGFQQFDLEVVERNGVQFQRYLVEKTL